MLPTRSRTRCSRLPAFDGRRLWFAGIGGAGMSALAFVTRSLGAEVAGWDRVATPYLDTLAGVGVAVSPEPPAPPDGWEIVVSTAYAGAVEGRTRGELLAELVSGQRSIVVAGAHGKTTTASMIAYCLRELDLDPTFLIGGSVAQLGGNQIVRVRRKPLLEPRCSCRLRPLPERRLRVILLARPSRPAPWTDGSRKSSRERIETGTERRVGVLAQSRHLVEGRPLRLQHDAVEPGRDEAVPVGAGSVLRETAQHSRVEPLEKQSNRDGHTSENQQPSTRVVPLVGIWKQLGRQEE